MLIEDFLKFSRSHNRKVITCCTVSQILVFIVCFSCLFVSRLDAADIADQVVLSQEEQAWLQSHVNITLSQSDNYEPYLIVHSDDSRSGVFVDFLAHLNKRVGTHIQLSVGTLDETLAELKEGKVEGTLALHPDYIDKLGLLKTQTYLRGYPALFAARGLLLNSPADLVNKKIVHLNSEYYSKNIIDQYGQGSTIISVDSVLEGFRVLDISPFIISQKDSAPSGIAIDYLELLVKRTGIQFDYELSTKTFGEAIDGIKRHQGPDLIPVIVSSPERKQSIFFTKKYVSSPIMIFIRSGDKQLITKIDDLAGKKNAI